MKNKQLFKLFNLMENIEGRQAGIKFSYFIAKNKMKIKKEIELINDLRKPTESFIEYDSKRAKLAMEYADKNEDGTPIIENSNYTITKRLPEFQVKIEELKEEYKEVIEEQIKLAKELDEILEQDVTFSPAIRLDIKDMPKEIEPVVLETLLEADMLIEPVDVP